MTVSDPVKIYVELIEADPEVQLMAALSRIIDIMALNGNLQHDQIHRATTWLAEKNAKDQS